jgi:hypothetical protein
MTLAQKQRLFTKLVGTLIARAYAEGFELSFGEAWRTPEQAATNARKGIGIKNSLHVDRLAIDFNLFTKGIYQKEGIAHHELGEWWEEQHPLCRWGGRFGDGNHYSLEHGGRK